MQKHTVLFEAPMGSTDWKDLNPRVCIFNLPLPNRHYTNKSINPAFYIQKYLSWRVKSPSYCFVPLSTEGCFELTKMQELLRGE